MNLTDITSLARPLDLDYGTNKAIAVLSLFVFCTSTIFWMVAGKEVLDSASWGFIASLAVFLSWALARELDPEYDLSAFVTTGLSLFGLMVLRLPTLMLLFWILLLTRIVNRTSGLPARRLDSLFLLLLAGWLTFNENVLVGVMTSLAFFIDGFLSQPQRHQFLFAGIQVVISGISFYVNGVIFYEGTVVLTLAVAVMSSLFLVVIVDSRKVRAFGDQKAELLDPRRVQSAQLIALATAVLLSVWNGAPGMVSLMPLWAAIAGTSLYRFVLFARTFWSG